METPQPPTSEEITLPEAATANQSFLARNWQKLTAVAFWVILIALTVWYARANNLGPIGAIQQIVDILRSPVGPLIYIGVYLLRPLVFFPATVLTIAGGSIFGAVGGILYTVIGANGSATVAYFLGRFLGTGLLESGQDDDTQGFVNRWAGRMRNNAFDTVLIMRFLFLPYDLVNYLSGFLRIKYPGFLLATIIGSIPGTIAFVLFGASIELENLEEVPSLDPVTFGVSIVIFVVSLGFSRYLKRREASKTADAADERAG